MYTLIVKKQALKAILSQVPAVRDRMFLELDMLEADPDDPDLDIEPVAGSAFLRLKFRSPARGFRAIFSRDDSTMTITVRAVEPRGQAYTIRRLQR